jgi:A/G-specific adenine glycosylase
MSFVVDDSRVVLFQQKIWDRYSDHKRDLPRRKTHDPYHVLVSEIMLHQTQVSRVISYFHRFLDQFPDLSALAA